MPDRSPIPSLIAVALGLALSAAAQESKPAAKTAPALKIVPAGPMPAQSQDDLKKKRAEKLAKPVFKNAAWTTDYDAARKRAKEEGKLVLTYFTRSYAH